MYKNGFGLAGWTLVPIAATDAGLHLKTSGMSVPQHPGEAREKTHGSILLMLPESHLCLVCLGFLRTPVIDWRSWAADFIGNLMQLLLSRFPGSNAKDQAAAMHRNILSFWLIQHH